MTISEKLTRIRQLDKDLIPEAIEDAERYYYIATACTPKYENDGSQHAISGNNKEKAMLNYAEATLRIEALQDELADLKLDMIKCVSHIKDDKQRRFAKLYYIDQKTQKQIAEQSHYARQTIKNNISFANKVLLSTTNDIEVSES